MVLADFSVALGFCLVDSIIGASHCTGLGSALSESSLSRNLGRSEPQSTAVRLPSKVGARAPEGGGFPQCSHVETENLEPKRNMSGDV